MATGDSPKMDPRCDGLTRAMNARLKESKGSYFLWTSGRQTIAAGKLLEVFAKWGGATARILKPGNPEYERLYESLLEKEDPGSVASKESRNNGQKVITAFG